MWEVKVDTELKTQHRMVIKHFWHSWQLAQDLEKNPFQETYFTGEEFTHVKV